MMFTIEPMINAGRRDIRELRRRLDHRHARPLAVGAVGAHGAGHRHRLRGAHRVGRQPAAAGVRRPAQRAARPCGRLKPDRSRRARAWPLLERRPAPRACRRCARSFRDGKAALVERFSARAPTAPARRAARSRAPGAPRRRARWSSCGSAAACRRARRWSRWAATGAASCSRYSDVDVLVLLPGTRRRRARQRRAARRGRRLHHRLLGRGPGDRLVGAHRRRVRRRGAARRDGADRDARVALPLPARSAAVRALQPAPPRRRWTRRPSCAPRRSRCASATSSTRTRRTRWSPTARRARAACATCRW